MPHARGGALILRSVLLVIALLPSPAAAGAQDAAKGAATEPHPDLEARSAPVEIDGVEIFRVQGSRSFAAETRAAGIAQRIIALAKDPSFRTDALRVSNTD